MINSRRIVMLTVLLGCIVIGLVFYMSHRASTATPTADKAAVKEGPTITPTDQETTASPQPSQQDFISVFEKSVPGLTDTSGQPIFGVTNISNPLGGWYVVTFAIRGSDGPAKVVFLQTENTNNPLTIVYNSYSPLSMELQTLPQAVRNAVGL